MAAAFTTWSDLYASILDRLASGDYRIKALTVAGKSFTFNTDSETKFMDLLDRVKMRVCHESGKRVRRLHLKNGVHG